MSQGSQGTATILDDALGTFSYIPQAGASGADSFRYRVSDGSLQATGTINITIRSAGMAGRRLFLTGLWK